MGNNRELSPEELRRTFDLTFCEMEGSDDLAPLEGIIGQDRAVSALRTGLGIRDQGFNIYVSGEPGTGKMTAVRAFLGDVARQKGAPCDWVYVNNFEDPSQPKAMKLPLGRGRQFQQDIKLLMERINWGVQNSFETEAYINERDKIVREMGQKREETLEHMARQASKAGFALRPTSFGFVILPVHDGHPLEEEEFLALPAREQEDIKRRRNRLEDELRTAFRELRQPERLVQEKVWELDRQVAALIIDDYMGEIKEKYTDLPEVIGYLLNAQNSLNEEMGTLRPHHLPDEEDSGPDAPWSEEFPLHKYEVNVLVDHTQTEQAPVVVEMNPSYPNLFGRIDKESHFGTLYTDFTMLRAGAMHRANGGYLVLPVEEVLKNPFSWDSLKRALQSRQIEMEEPAERLGFSGPKGLRPMPIPLDIKVILVGRPLVYYLLEVYDLDFQELFKVRADFDTSMPATEENIHKFLRLLATFCRREKLRSLNLAAMATILEHASRLAENKRKISTHFGLLSDVLREADFLALQEEASLINDSHVKKALEGKVYRSSLLKERTLELVHQGALLIDTTGKVPGQVNGIACVGVGDYTFGKPSRITATVGPGGQGIIDIEREVELGGALHSKGVLIVGGYLTQKYSQDMLLSLAGRVVFEQSYEGVEGDSASCAELFAILSALSGLPIQQGIAVTGSVNQYGEVQAIGEVNQKIEGFFETCVARGLTGSQGVIIPRANVENLMLDEVVVEAIRSGTFHVWAVQTVDEGMEILTGVPAGELGPDGEFPAGTINYLVKQRLESYGEYLKEFPDSVAGPGDL